MNLMPDQYLEIQELSPILGVSQKAIYKWVESGKIDNQYLKKKPSRGRKGYKTLINPRGLKKKYRNKYKIHLAKTTKADLDRNEYESQLLAQLKPWQREKVLPYYTLIKKREQLGLKGKSWEKALEVYNKEHPDQKDVTMKSLYRNWRDYREGGLEAIIPDYGNHAGESKVPDDLYEVFEELYMTQNRRSKQECWRKTLGFAVEHERVLIEDGTYYLVDPNTGKKTDTFPHFKTFYRQIEKNYSEDAIILARKGEQGLRQSQADYFLNRDLTNLPAGEVWVSDHRQLDVLVSSAKKDIKRFVKTLIYDQRLDESDREEMEQKVRRAVAANFDSNRPVRLWCTAWVDFKTGKWLSWYLHADPPATDHVLLSFKWAAEEYGAPTDIIIDNGKDYTARDVAGGRSYNHTLDVNERYTQGIMYALNINTHFAIPENARAKTIERQFRYSIESFEKDFQTYTGKDASDRPEITSINAKKGNYPRAAEFIRAFDKFIKNLNHQARGGREHDGHSPNSLWKRDFKEKRVLRPGALQAIAMRSSNVKKLTGNGFKDPDLDHYYYASWMAGHVGERVYIKRDPEQWDEAIVVRAKDGEILGRATVDIKVPGMARTEEEKAAFRQKKAHQSERNRIRKEQLKHLKGIDWEKAQQYYGSFIEIQKDLIAHEKDLEKLDPKVVNKLQNTPFDDIPEKLEQLEKTGTDDLDDIDPGENKRPSKLKSIWDE